MSDADVVPVKPEIAAHALVTRARYDEMTAQAANAPEIFWAAECKRIDWIKHPAKIKNTSFTGDVSIKWFEDGTLNVAANCLDRHLAERGGQVAIIWESDDPAVSKRVTYRELHEQVCRLANVLSAQGIKKGDVVTV
jgi:acetyl-CoA synthetase